MVRRLIALAGGMALGGALTLAAPAVADPGMPNCGQLSFVCNMVPAMPDLDHDIDMTKGQPPMPNHDSDPPADVCAVACI